MMHDTNELHPESNVTDECHGSIKAAMHAMADIASDLALAAFRKPLAVSFKAAQSAVTEVDCAIEWALRRYIHDHWPDHGIVGEEFEDQHRERDYVWVIDPIDGTSAFVCGKPTFCTLIALLYRGQAIMGMIVQPVLGERYWGALGQASTRNNEPCLRRSLPDGLHTAVFNTTTPLMFAPTDRPWIEALASSCALASFGGDGYAYALLAAGQIDVIVEADLKFYDVAALLPIIVGMGGVLLNWQGQPVTQDHFDGCVIAARHMDLAQAVLHHRAAWFNHRA
jgi:histidinol phosphatase-like enzyme (inositol monophosphatase family)